MQHDNNSPKHLAFVIFSLRRGGAERVVVSLANYFSNLGHKIDIILIGASSNEPPAFELDFKVLVKSVLCRSIRAKNPFSRALSILERISKLRKTLKSESYDCVFSFTRDVNLLCAIASLGLGKIMVMSERNHPIRFLTQSKLRKFLVRLFYPRAHAIIVQTHEIARHYSSFSRVRIIPNPILLARTDRISQTDLSTRIVGAGRLVPQKGFERLLLAAAALRSLGFYNQLVLFGDGPDRLELENLAVKLGLGRQIFSGEVPNLVEHFRDADIFVLTSKYEGFPNVLLEAMAAGATPVAFDCLSGPSEIIQHGINGFLVPEGDVENLVKRVEELILNPRLRSQMSLEAKKVSKKYPLSEIARQWLDLVP